MAIRKIEHYAVTNAASMYDVEAMTALELAGRIGVTLNAAIDEVESYDARIIAIEIEETEINEHLTVIDGNLDSLDLRLTTVEGDIDGLEARMTTAEGDIDSLETRMTTAEGDIDGLEARMTTAEGDIDSLESRMTAAEGDIDSLERTRVTTAGDIYSLKTRMTTAEGDIDSLETRMTTAEGDIDTNSNGISTNTSAISDLTADVSSLSGNVSSLTSRVAIAENDITSDEQRITALELAPTSGLYHENIVPQFANLYKNNQSAYSSNWNKIGWSSADNPPVFGDLGVYPLYHPTPEPYYLTFLCGNLAGRSGLRYDENNPISVTIEYSTYYNNVWIDHVQTYVNNITSVTSICRFTIPNIDADSYIEFVITSPTTFALRYYAAVADTEFYIEGVKIEYSPAATSFDSTKAGIANDYIYVENFNTLTQTVSNNYSLLTDFVARMNVNLTNIDDDITVINTTLGTTESDINALEARATTDEGNISTNTSNISVINTTISNLYSGKGSYAPYISWDTGNYAPYINYDRIGSGLRIFGNIISRTIPGQLFFTDGAVAVFAEFSSGFPIAIPTGKIVGQASIYGAPATSPLNVDNLGTGVIYLDTDRKLKMKVKLYNTALNPSQCYIDCNLVL